MLGNDRRRIELAYALQFSLRGTPVLRYGEEIGMGEDLSLPGRDAIRTPMQWSYQPNGGFSTAEPEKLVRPVIDRGEFGYEKVNVTAQRHGPDVAAGLVRADDPHAAGGAGDRRRLAAPHVDVPMPPGVLAHRADGPTGTMLFLHNLGTEDARSTSARSAAEADHAERRARRPGVRRRWASWTELEAGRLRLPLDPAAPQPAGLSRRPLAVGRRRRWQLG